MHTSVIVLACLAHCGHAIVDKKAAFAELLLAINPSPSRTRTRGSTMVETGVIDGPVTRSKFAAGELGLGEQPVMPLSVADRSPSPLIVQGGTLKTWTYGSPLVERVQVYLATEGRPLDADIELWNGPDNTPMKVRVYSEDGNVRPFNCIFETPSQPNTIAVRNIGGIEFPLVASMIANEVDEPYSDFSKNAKIGQGGALTTYPFPANVQAVELMIRTDGRPLNARIELLQGPNNNKQVMEVYSDDGLTRPFFGIIETVGAGNVLRVQNSGPVEFPMLISAQPRATWEGEGFLQPVLGGGNE